MKFQHIACLALLTGCQAAPQPNLPFPPAPAVAPSGMTVQLSSSEQANIQAGVRSFLKDPASAIFSGPVLAAKQPNGELTACGSVNAKNSYGGYTGAAPFIATVRNGVVIDSIASSGRSAQTIIQMCQQRGVL